MIVLALCYGLLFLTFIGAIVFIFFRRRRRAVAHAPASGPPAPATTSTLAGAVHVLEKDGHPLEKDSGESDGDGDGFDETNKTMTIAHAGAQECKGSPASDGTPGTKRYYTCDEPSGDWTTMTPVLPRSLRYSSRTWTQTQMSLPYPGPGNVSELSVAQRERETSQVLVWLPSFQSNVGGGTREGCRAPVL
uniref:Alcohol oxidase n=1 Tax=Ganoderma boninense TaxID=34458 RepID=A0A5K1JWA7_9APHY|nr:Alcohol oxidase [Ganoderma boninense]